MRCVCRQQDPSNPERRCTSLMHAVRGDICHIVLAWDWIPGKDLLESHGLTLDVLLAREAGSIGVCHTVHAVRRDTRGHVEVEWIDDIVNIVVGESGKIVVYLGVVSFLQSLNLQNMG